MNPIVVVDDEPAIRSSLAAVLEDEGYPVRCCAHAQEFYDALQEQPQHQPHWMLEQHKRGQKVSTQVTSQTIHLPLNQGTRVTPLGRFPFVCERLEGSKREGTLAEDRAQCSTSLRAE